MLKEGEKSLIKDVSLISKEEKTDQLILQKIFSQNQLNDFNEQSYHQFLSNGIKQILKEKEPKILYTKYQDKKRHDYFLSFGKIKITPQSGADQGSEKNNLDFRVKKGQTELLNLFVEISLRVAFENQVSEVIPARFYKLASIPLLLNSRYDSERDPSKNLVNYFIINGVPKLLCSQLTSLDSVFKISKTSNKSGVNTTYKILINKNLETYNIDSSNLVTILSKDRLRSKIPLVLLARVLGVSPKEILELNTGLDSLVMSTLLEPWYEYSLEEATEKLRILLSIQEEPEKELLAYCSYLLGVKDQEELKFKICSRLEELLSYNSGKSTPGFFDSLANKKFLTIGDTLKTCLSLGLDEFYLKIKTPLVKELSSSTRTRNMTHLVRPEIISKVFKKVINKSTKNEEEVLGKLFNYTNQVERVSDQRRIVTTLNKNLPHEEYRSVNPSEVGRICIAQSPHSKSVGLSEQLALGAKISMPLNTNEEKILEKILQKILEEDPLNKELKTTVTVNGIVKGHSSLKSKKIYELVCKLRKNLTIGLDYTDRSVNIRTTPGRILKIMYPVSKGKLLLDSLSLDEIDSKSLEELWSEGYIVYLDAAEELNSTIGLDRFDLENASYYYPKGNFTFSYQTAFIPLINTNAAHRVGLTLRFITQSLGEKSKQKYPVSGTKAEYLTRAEPSLVRTPFEKNMPQYLGSNMLVGIVGFDELTCEDSITMNLTAVQRGLLDYTMYKYDTYESPADEKGYYNFQASYQGLEGVLPQVGQKYPLNTPIINNMQHGIIIPKITSPGDNYVVNELTLTKDIMRNCKLDIEFKENRSITIGEKIASRQGQKGIIGGLVHEYNLPASEQGTCPGILLSPNLFLSRMTMGPLQEIILAKVAAHRGKVIQVPSICEDISERINYCKEYLERHDLSPDGTEKVLWGYGKESERIFIGPLKILLLEHHSRDKWFSRKMGKVEYLTHQPTSGKKSGGGLRFGEMQRDATLAHGANYFLRDRLGVDETLANVCLDCRILINNNKRLEGLQNCNRCKGTNLKVVSIPYALVLLIRTLRAAGVETHISPEAWVEDSEDINPSMFEEEDEEENEQ